MLCFGGTVLFTLFFRVNVAKIVKFLGGPSFSGFEGLSWTFYDFVGVPSQNCRFLGYESYRLRYRVLFSSNSIKVRPIGVYPNRDTLLGTIGGPLLGPLLLNFQGNTCIHTIGFWSVTRRTWVLYCARGINWEARLCLVFLGVIAI
jgi:hypothetical protein